MALFNYAASEGSARDGAFRRLVAASERSFVGQTDVRGAG